MKIRNHVFVFLSLLCLSCGSLQQSGRTKSAMPVPPPDRVTTTKDASVFPDPRLGKIQPATPVVLRDLPAVRDDSGLGSREVVAPEGWPEVPISDEEVERRREESLGLKPQSGLQVIETRNPESGRSRAPGLETSFETVNFDDGWGQTPPDPEMAAGPNHLIVVVNSMIEIYDTTGNTLDGPIASNTFFSGVAGCSGTFDPNVLYDEKEDRFFIGFDSSSGPGTDNGYCFAVSASSDPSGSWYRYSFDGTSEDGDFLDYPHAGIGDEAIFVGGNVFGENSTFHADVWAIRKSEAYANQAVSIVFQTVLGSTPQPMNAHGYAQGSWPTGSTHYILSDYFDGTTVVVQEWVDPFGTNSFTNLGTVDLNSASGVYAGYPLDTPQLGSGDNIQGNDYRIQDAEFRNGHIWIVQTIACNPGQGAVNCIRWAELDPGSQQRSPSVVQTGVFSSDGDYRVFADLAVNHCNDVTIAYTKSSASMHPSVYYTGRLGTDPVGSIQVEAELKAGEVIFTSYDSAPYRWGDYSGATPDPNGVDTWYVGEYSRNNSSISDWGTFVGRFSTDCQAPAPDLIFADGFEDGNPGRWSFSS